ncbi:MAG: alpha/beta fold hydrolase [Microbacteriaceae bacterium]|nr:alpha/beta fold hydrolase [Microbacteriaceae bacterium]
MPYVQSNGTRLWWESTGSGSPVLLINGLGSASTAWHRLRPRLAAHFRVITFDNRGAGRSDIPTEPYAFADMAKDAVSVLDAAGIDAAQVIGLSMGGLIAQEVALSQPDRVRSLVLASTHVGLPLLGEADPSVARQLEQASLLPAGERAKALVSIQYARETAEADILRDQEVASEFPTTPAGFQGQLEAAAPWARPDDLANLAIPTLVMHGIDDRMVAIAAGRRLAAAIPDAGFLAFERSGHQIFTDREEDAAAAVLEFLQSHE